MSFKTSARAWWGRNKSTFFRGLVGIVVLIIICLLYLIACWIFPWVKKHPPASWWKSSKGDTTVVYRKEGTPPIVPNLTPEGQKAFDDLKDLYQKAETRVKELLADNANKTKSSNDWKKKYESLRDSLANVPHNSEKVIVHKKHSLHRRNWSEESTAEHIRHADPFFQKSRRTSRGTPLCPCH